MLLFYLIPIIIVTWFIGKRAGIVIAIISCLVTFIPEIYFLHKYSSLLVLLSNFSGTLGVFVVAIYILSALLRITNESTRREMEVAREVQFQLLPQTLPSLKTLSYKCSCKPNKIVTGDYYDFILLEPEKMGIAVADICGKGLSAALLMANLQGLLRTHALIHREDLVSTINNINRSLCSSTDSSKYATLFYGIYYDSDRKLTYINAGHNAPMVFRNKLAQQNHFEVFRLETENTVIGLMPTSIYTQRTIQLLPDDIVVIFTDGLTDARDYSSNQYGEERLISLIKANTDSSANELHDLLINDYEKFSNGETQFDDTTIFVARVT
jgi:phosphoserine phosphatase RsbU/P